MNTQTQQIPMFSETVIVNGNDRIEISNDGADIVQTNFKKFILLIINKINKLNKVFNQ